MPVAADESTFGAFERLCENLKYHNFESIVGANANDATFLSNFMSNQVVDPLMRAYMSLEEPLTNPVSCDNIELLKDLKDDCSAHASKNASAKELLKILKNPHFSSLVEAHDDVAAKNFETLTDFASVVPAPVPLILPPTGTTDAIRMVGIRKGPGETLGITIRSEDRGLVIARILQGSIIDKQGLLHVGDIIKEVNGQEVNLADQLLDLLNKSTGNITLKILPGEKDASVTSQIYLKTYFKYDPRRDNLIPCREAGLAFNDGDILQVVNREDSNWWQARRVDADGPSGLIPSQALEERRKAFVRPEYDYTHKSLLCGLMTKKKQKIMYQSRQNGLDSAEILIYEEVARMPPFQRKTLVLIGAQGVGRRTLKHRLIKADPSRFAAVIPHTSRPPRPGEVNGDAYWFVTAEEMIQDIMKNSFLEHGEFQESLYGTKFEIIRHCIRSGRMCVLDISPQSLKGIKTAEYMPYVVFIASPPIEILRSMHELARMRGMTDKIKTEQDFRDTLEESKRIEKRYKHFFDLTITNDNMDESYNKLRRAIEQLSTEAQWVPVTWVY